jgi:hypothetical protein
VAHRMVKVVGAGLLVLSAAACGVSDDGTARLRAAADAAEVDAAVLVSSAQATTQVTTARLHMVMEVSGSGIPPITVVADGEQDFAAGRSEMTINLESGLGLGLTDTRVVQDGTTVYMTGGAFDALGVDGRWVKISADAIDQAPGDTSGSDPAAFLSFLRAARRSTAWRPRTTARPST